MMRKLSTIILAAFFSLFATFAYAQETDPQPVDKKIRNAVIDSVTSSYSNWGRVALSGKLSASMLPVSASVKVYMEKDKLLLISVSAPLIGEAARIEMDRDRLLIVNKLNKTYSEVDVENIEAVYPGGLADLQSLLLGRVTLMNAGTLRKINADDILVFDSNPQKWILVPDDRYQTAGLSYLYTVDRNDFRLSNFLLMADNQSMGTQLFYDWKSGGAYNIDFEAAGGNMSFSGQLSFSAPQWGAEPFDRFQLSSKYSKVSIFDIIKM